MNIAFPTENPVLIVAIAMIMFLVAPMISKHFRLPSIIGLILAGALVGPNALGLLERDVTIQLLGTVGLQYLMFLAGLELDLLGFARYRNRSLIFGGLSFIVPLLLALFIMPWFGFSIPAALLIGAIVASHTLLAYPIASRLGITKNTAVTTVMGGTLLTDTLSLGVLAVIDALVGDDVGVLFWLRLVGGLALYLVVVLWGLPRLGRWFFRNTDAEASVRFLFLMSALFVSAFLAEFAGAQPIIGAFLAGLALNRLIPEQSTLMTRVRFVGNTLLIPFFLFSVGMLVDFSVLVSGLEVLILAAVLVGIVLFGKSLAAVISQRIFKFTNAQGFTMAGLSIPQAAATLAVTFVGLEIGLFDVGVVNAVIVLILVSSVVGSSLVERFGRQVAIAEQSEAYSPSTAPHRILVPLANPANAEALLDIAFLLRDKGSDEAVFPLTVVPDNAQTLSSVAGAERMLAHAVVYAAEADVPVNPLTRIAQNPASGIVRAATERRITDIIIGWKGGNRKSRWIIGNIIDQLLEHTEQLVLVCKIEHPVNTFKRLVVILPPFVDYSPGFYGSVRTIKLMASQLGAGLHVMAIQGDTNRFQQRFTEVGPEVEATYDGITGWRALHDALDETLTDNDLVVMVSARRGTVAHSRELERLPTELTEKIANVLVLYPSEQEIRQETGIPSLLSEDRLICDLSAHTFSEAVNQLLETTTFPITVNRSRVVEMLLKDDVGYASEVLPGILIMHARVQGLRDCMMFLGISDEGILHKTTQKTVHVITVLLTPADLPAQEHLALLAEVTQQLSHGGRLPDLIACRNFQELRAWFGTNTRR